MGNDWEDISDWRKNRKTNGQVVCQRPPRGSWTDPPPRYTPESTHTRLGENLYASIEVKDFREIGPASLFGFGLSLISDDLSRGSTKSLHSARPEARISKRVDSDTDGALEKQAIAEHRGNLDVYSATKQAEFIDDLLPGTGKGGERVVKLLTVSTGDGNRWHTQMGGNTVDYANALEKMSTLASFTTAPLGSPLAITGQAALQLRLSCAAKDPSVIAYLVAVDSKGSSYYITEGHLRMIQRKLKTAEQTLHTYRRKDAEQVIKDDEMEADLTLLPTSVLLTKGMRLRLLLAGGDDSTFATSVEYEAKIAGASRLVLPVR